MLLRPANGTWSSFRHDIVVRLPDFVYARHRDLSEFPSDVARSGVYFAQHRSEITDNGEV